MLKFYFNLSPNPTKVALFLEEAAIPYEAVPVNASRGEQFRPEFLRINPNGKLPAIDDDGIFIFDSNAILLYLAEKLGRFLPPGGPENRAGLLSWLMFAATGIGPFCGQAVHFKYYIPKEGPAQPYGHERYQYEARRHFKILDEHLAGRHFMLGDSYTIVDMDVWGWARNVEFILGDGAWAEFPHLKRLVDEISARPAAVRAIGLKDKFTFQPMDNEGRQHMFKHIGSAGAAS